MKDTTKVRAGIVAASAITTVQVFGPELHIRWVTVTCEVIAWTVFAAGVALVVLFIAEVMRSRRRHAKATRRRNLPAAGKGGEVR